MVHILQLLVVKMSLDSLWSLQMLCNSFFDLGGGTSCQHFQFALVWCPTMCGNNLTQIWNTHTHVMAFVCINFRFSTYL